jgi:hypothetical protein
MPIDRIDQADVLSQAMYRANATALEPPHAVVVLILNVARRVHRPRLFRPRPRPQPSLDPASPPRDRGLPSLLLLVAPRPFLMSTRLHSKFPSWCQSFWLLAAKLCTGVRTFRVFVYLSISKRACTGN